MGRARGDDVAQPWGVAHAIRAMVASVVRTLFSLGTPRQPARTSHEGAEEAAAASSSPTPWLPEQVCTAKDVGHTCQICLEKYCVGERTKRLPCLHAFHTSCIDAWLRQATTCPQCRHDVYDAGGVACGSHHAAAVMDSTEWLPFEAMSEAEQEEALIWNAYLTDAAAISARARNEYASPELTLANSLPAATSGRGRSRRITWRRWMWPRLGSAVPRSTASREHMYRSSSAAGDGTPRAPPRRPGDPFPSSSPASRRPTPSSSPRRSRSLGSSSLRRSAASTPAGARAGGPAYSTGQRSRPSAAARAGAVLEGVF